MHNSNNDPYSYLALCMLSTRRYDSVHGQYKGTVTHQDGKLIIDGKPIVITSWCAPHL